MKRGADVIPTLSHNQPSQLTTGGVCGEKLRVLLMAKSVGWLVNQLVFIGNVICYVFFSK